jgi:putative FmdB family regulatory protein
MLYDYFCDNCFYRFESFNSVANRAHGYCPQCGRLSRMIFSPGASIAIFKPYWDIHTTWEPVHITSKKQRMQHLKAHNVYEK